MVGRGHYEQVSRIRVGVGAQGRCHIVVEEAALVLGAMGGSTAVGVWMVRLKCIRGIIKKHNYPRRKKLSNQLLQSKAINKVQHRIKYPANIYLRS